MFCFRFDPATNFLDVALLKLRRVMPIPRNRFLSPCKRDQVPGTLLSTCGLGTILRDRILYPTSLKQIGLYRVFSKAIGSFNPTRDLQQCRYAAANFRLLTHEKTSQDLSGVSIMPIILSYVGAIRISLNQLNSQVRMSLLNCSGNLLYIFSNLGFILVKSKVLSRYSPQPALWSCNV